ncbi:hypothetical protein EV647_4662 [Kribbella sp. VKM Ac-2566]|nr:hypothetical protein EV647_4662 [Kribbella sp. VKM Ac-2566]
MRARRADRSCGEAVGGGHASSLFIRLALGDLTDHRRGFLLKEKAEIGPQRISQGILASPNLLRGVLQFGAVEPSTGQPFDGTPELKQGAVRGRRQQEAKFAGM